ncbi:MAG: HPr family phosphocarrier protein [Clostridiales bacterium]|nr:HPr family phosphocarrier protein [Clostridiales bacterium]
MYSKKTVIANNTGLHARPASDFIANATKFKSRIFIKRLDSGDEANAKSIIMLLSLALDKGTEVEIYAEGEDEITAVNSLIDLIDSKFGEDK